MITRHTSLILLIGLIWLIYPSPALATTSSVNTPTSSITIVNENVYLAKTPPTLHLTQSVSLAQKITQFVRKISDRSSTPVLKIVNPVQATILTQSLEDSSSTISLESSRLIPGKYTAYIDDQEITSFSWGILAINTNKSIYYRGDTARLAMAVLDEQGEMICDSQLNLTIKDPQGLVTQLSTKTGEIVVNQECQSKNVTLKPDYETTYQVGADGIYSLTLSSTTLDNTTTIHDSFKVDSSSLFDVERETATRIFPQNIYSVTIKVTAKADFVGTFTEKVPADFVVTGLTSWPLDLKSGQSTMLKYSYDAPDISPEFYLLGPAKITKLSDPVFTEFRPWQIAVDVPTQVSSATDTTTTNTAYEQMNSMTITPGAGDYMVHFSSSIKNTTGSTTQHVSLFVAGSQVTHTERQLLTEGSFDTFERDSLPVSIDAYVAGVGASDVIEIQWKTTGGTSTAHERTLIVQPVTASDISQATATADTTCTFASTCPTDAQLGSMTLTPGAGNYIVYFSGTMEGPAASNIYTSIYVNGSQVAHSERALYSEASFPNSSWGVSTQAYVESVGAGQAIEVKWRITTGTATSHERTLVVQKVSSGSVTQATATSDDTTTSTTDAALGSMSITPGAGNYLVFFSTAIKNSFVVTTGSTQNISLYVGGSQVGHSERQIFTEESMDAGDVDSFPVTSHAYITGVGASDAIEVKWRTTAGTATSHQRTLTAFNLNSLPSTPSLDSPADSSTDQSVTPALLTTGTDIDSDYLRYKIELCTNAAMTTGCQTFDQTSSQTGWSGQNTQSNTAYTSGTQATYTVQSSLSNSTTYYWRSYGIDPGGRNTFSGTQTPRSFTTIAAGGGGSTSVYLEGVSLEGININ